MNLYSQLYSHREEKKAVKFQSVSRLDFGVNPNYSAAKFPYAPASHLHARRKLCVNGVWVSSFGVLCA